MTSNLFVGGLPYEITREEVAKLFAPCGTVANVKLIMDGFSGRCKGFGFVEMSTEAEALAAMAKLNGTAIGERKLFISEARPQQTRPGASPGKPGFVERRSGLKDRRRPQPAVAGEKRPQEAPRQDGARREGLAGAKPWRKGPGGFGGKRKPWEKPSGDAGRPQEAPRQDGAKREGFAGAKPWRKGPGGFGGKRKPWEKPSGDAGRRKDFGGKKKWGGKRPGAPRRDERRPS